MPLDSAHATSVIAELKVGEEGYLRGVAHDYWTIRVPGKLSTCVSPSLGRGIGRWSLGAAHATKGRVVWG